MAVLPLHTQDTSNRPGVFRLPRRYLFLGLAILTTLFLVGGPSRPPLPLGWRPVAGNVYDADLPPLDAHPPPNVGAGEPPNTQEHSLPPMPEPEPVVEPSPWPARAQLVKEAFLHGYMAYDQVAFPMDEYRPITERGVNNFNGWGLTAIDALDTMIVMGFDDMVERVVSHVASIRFSNTSTYVPFFETTIRYLGGLISAYALDGNPILLSRADDLGRALLPAFNTTFGLPAFSVDVQSGQIRDGWTGPSVILSEIGSASLEFRALAHYTGRKEYAQAVDGVTTFLQDVRHTDGLLPLRYSRWTGEPQDNDASVGAFADSTYEYFLKGWLQTNRTEDRLRDLYVEAVDGIIENLLYVSPQRGLLYVTDTSGDARYPSGKLEHLSCFLAGLLALGHATLPSPPDTHLWAAQGLATTCWLTYADTATGLGPDEVSFRPPSGGDPEEYARWSRGEFKWVHALQKWEDGGRVGPVPGTADVEPITDHEDIEAREWSTNGRTGYLLRPETVESLFILHRVTRDPKWRERGWQIFEAIERHARLERGYATVHDVTFVPDAHFPKDQWHQDEQASWFFAETLKYFYLLFSDEEDAARATGEAIPLDGWVFSTEAHPLPVFEWAAWEREAFNITLSAPAKKAVAAVEGPLLGLEGLTEVEGPPGVDDDEGFWAVGLPVGP